jgi:hypothetical protein
MTKRFLRRALSTTFVASSIILLGGQAALAQPMGPPGSGEGEGMPWQVAALFTANWVLAAVAVVILSRPPKRADKPKKAATEEAA